VGTYPRVWGHRNSWSIPAPRWCASPDGVVDVSRRRQDTPDEPGSAPQVGGGGELERELEAGPLVDLSLVGEGATEVVHDPADDG